MTPTPTIIAPPSGGLASLGGLSGYLVPLCIGGGLVIGLGAAGYALLRRRKGQRQ